MAATKKGVWNVQEVRDKQLASEWPYVGQAGSAKLFTWGYNNAGRLGHNDTSNYSSPTQVTGDWYSIHPTQADNQAFSLFSKNLGDLWGSGRSYEGALGLNTGETGPEAWEYSSPVQIPGTTWNQTAAGGNVTISSKTDGTLWMFGQNNYGGLGDNTTVKKSSPIQVGTDTTWTGNVSCGSGCAFAIKTDGTLWSWGNNQQYGALGLNENGPGQNKSSPCQVGTETTWSSLTVGDGGVMAAIKTDNTLWVWGRNYRSVLGQNEGTGSNNTSRSSPTQLPGTNWTSVSNGGMTMCATKSDNTLWIWGDNSYGELGENSRTNRSSPVQIPGSWSKVRGDTRTGYTSVAFKTDGSLWSWGNNHYGELGLNDIISRSSPTQVPAPSGTWHSFNMSAWGGHVSALIQ